MKRGINISDDRDMPLLGFLWKFKVASSRALIKRFFPNTQPMTAYRRISKLAKHGFIQCYGDTRNPKFVWLITKKGFKTIRETLPALKELGFGSEYPGHDLVVTAVHLGDWLCGEPPGVRLFTEQQLRRFHIDYYPQEISKSTRHRPDGYWILNDGTKSRTIALEVELNPKENSAYDDLAKFYSHETNVASILWVVQHPWMAKHLHKLITKAIHPRANNHDFVVYDDFVKQGWQAVIKIGANQNKSISELLMTDPHQTVRNCPKDLVTLEFLDTRKTPGLPATSRFYQIGDFA